MTVLTAAKSFHEEIRTRAQEIEAGRRMPADLAARMAGAGLFRMVLLAGFT
jgi:hypothetical protein